MSDNKNIVNEIIKKIKDINHKKNEDNKNELLVQKQEEKIIENDNSFNQLLSLQILIQKHSGLKELCKK